LQHRVLAIGRKRCSTIGGADRCPPKAKVTRSNRVGCAILHGSVPDTWVTFYTEDIGKHFWSERICKGFEPASLVEISEIVIHKADEPDRLIGLFDSDGLAGGRRTPS
jgi:hypothetical protein